MGQSPSRVVTFIIQSIAILLLLFMGSQRLTADLWNDELYTLDYFTIQPLSVTLTDYHVPNNHVFYNLINNLYLRILGIDDINLLLDHPWVIRLPGLVYAICMIWLVWLLAVSIADRLTAAMAVIFMLTSVGWVHFALQVRGYGLSMLFLIAIVVLVHKVWSGSSRKYMLILAVSVAGSIYTLPSNLYIIAGVFSVVLFTFFLRRWRGMDTAEEGRAVVAIVCGIGLSLCLLIPIWTQVFDNVYVNSGGLWDGQLLMTYYLPQLYHGFMSEKGLLLIPAVLGLSLILLRRNKGSDVTRLILAMIVAPVIISTIRADGAPVRVFVVVAPLFAVALALGASRCSELMLPDRYRQWVTLIVVIASVVAYRYAYTSVSDEIYVDITHKWRQQNLTHQYYSHHYRPAAEVRAYVHDYSSVRLPLLVEGAEAYGLPYYLRRHSLTWSMMDQLDSLVLAHGCVHVFTSKPNGLNATGRVVTQLAEDYSYHTLMEVCVVQQ